MGDAQNAAVPVSGSVDTQNALPGFVGIGERRRRALSFGSLFSGIGGFDLGFERAGMCCAWQCEVDPACRSVLRRHFTNLEIYPDVKQLCRHGSHPPEVDVLCGGFPCQDLSVAGKRKGLAGARSGLWREFRRVAGVLKPRVVVIENVPGLLSSMEGRDFACLIQGLVKLGYRLAWRVLDSQYDRVAQRRRRVFIAGSLGDGRCAEILFEPESLRGHPAPGSWAPQEVAGTIGASAARSRGVGIQPETLVTGCLNANGKAAGSATQQDAESGLLIAHALNAKGGSGRMDGVIETFVVAGTLRSGAANGGRGHGSRAGDKDDHLVVAHTLRAQGFDASEDGTGRGTPLVAHTLASTSSPGSDSVRCYATQSGVRRLTPRECERLQSFPDDWTRWTDTGKEQKDGPRYKQLGNAVTVNVTEWIGSQIVQALGISSPASPASPASSASSASSSPDA